MRHEIPDSSVVSLDSGSSGHLEIDLYKSLVGLCNEVLRTIRDKGTDLVTELNKLFKPSPSHQIEFVRYDNLCLTYDWFTKPINGEVAKLMQIPVGPDVLIVTRDAIGGYRVDQEAAKRKKGDAEDLLFDPGDPPERDSKARIGLKDVLGCVETKWNEGTTNENDSRMSQDSGELSDGGCFLSCSYYG